ncbi:pyridoxal phosphate-dependent transferase [Lipomyces oligophaga]|uniref:pyridoxal phosphate-dependent transferase n=1 Tax=Lipomyces oligophaga TaxID=45792 RepID=UPI0034CF33B7
MPANQTKLATLFAQAQAQIQLPSATLPSQGSTANSADGMSGGDSPALILSRTISESIGASKLDLSPEEIKRREMQFGPLTHPSHKYVSQHPKGEPVPEVVIEDPPLFHLIFTFISYLILIIIGHIEDFFGKRFRKEQFAPLIQKNGYAALTSDFDSFYTRRLKRRLDDCFSRPTIGVPGRFIRIFDRITHDNCDTFEYLGTTTDILNLSSYNYLGFAQSEGQCADAAIDIIQRYSTSSGGPRAVAGTTDLHLETEDLVARFVGKESSMIFSMGYATNAAAFPSLVSKGCLIISDELNHASIRFGARLSGAVIRTFKHNDMHDLERLLREQISQGQPRHHRPWKKILIVVEGLYSMEGTMCNLPGLLELRKKYKFYLFVDEAHSIGAMGPRGRGVCDYFGIDPAEVDILMGTLTKSFGASGGYIAADKKTIDALKYGNMAYVYAESISPPILAQIQASLRTIMGEIVPGEGEERLQRLAFNSRYLRLGLKRLGFIVYGHDDSPIIPLLLFCPAKMPAFSREMLKRNIGVVVVGYPATPLVSSRVRFCLSSALNKEDLDVILRACDELGDQLMLKIRPANERGEKLRWNVDDVIRKGVVDTKRSVRLDA